MADKEQLDLDDIQLQAQGHEAVMPRQFTLWSLLAFAIAVASAWVAVSSLLTTHLMFAGPVGAFWTPIVSGLASMVVTIGLAELASAFPSSGGQYHYSFMVANEKYRQAAAFTVGWLNVLEWLFGSCAAIIYPAQLTMQVAQMYNPSFTYERWQIWLLYVALIAAGTAVVTLCAASHTKASASYACIDSTTHISEEIHEPGKHVPRAMMLATGIAILSNVVFTLAAMFNISSLPAVVASSFPIYEIARQAISSDGAVLFLLIWLIFTFYSTIPGVLLTTGRLVWALSRDNGLPCSSYFNRISPRYKVPVQAHIVSAIFCMIYGLIYIGSTVGFNAILSTTIVFAFLSYSAPQAFLLMSGRDILPQAHFRLGKVVGTLVNLFSVVWTLIFCVFLSFPLTLPTSPQGMSYVSVVLVGFLCIIALLWFLGGKRQSFNGPDIRMELLQGVNIAQMRSTKVDHKELKD